MKPKAWFLRNGYKFTEYLLNDKDLVTNYTAKKDGVEVYGFWSNTASRYLESQLKKK